MTHIDYTQNKIISPPEEFKSSERPNLFEFTKELIQKGI